MATRAQKFQKLSFTEEFDQTLEQFTQIIAWDPAVSATIKETEKRKGLFSPAVRYLIRKYVDFQWPRYVAEQKGQLKKTGEEIGAT